MGETSTLDHGDTLELLEGKYAFTIIYENPINSFIPAFPDVPIPFIFFLYKTRKFQTFPRNCQN